MRSVNVHRFFLGRKQIEEERRQAGIIERLRDQPIARAVAAAAAAVNEKHHTTGIGRHADVAVKGCRTRRNSNFGVHR
jgi:hypothetical protein